MSEGLYESSMHQMLRAIVELQNARIEADLVAAMGWEKLPPLPEFATMGFTLVYQRVDGELMETYRGIQRHGEWIVDHYPDWPDFAEEPR